MNYDFCHFHKTRNRLLFPWYCCDSSVTLLLPVNLFGLSLWPSVFHRVVGAHFPSLLASHLRFASDLSLLALFRGAVRSFEVLGSGCQIC